METRRLCDRGPRKGHDIVRCAAQPSVQNSRPDMYEAIRAYLSVTPDHSPPVPQEDNDMTQRKKTVKWFEKDLGLCLSLDPCHRTLYTHRSFSS